MNRILTVAAILSTLSGPSSWGAEKAAGWQRYFPLATGSSWTYAMTNHRSGERRRFTVVVKGSQLVESMRRNMVIVDEDQVGEHLPVGYFGDDEGFLNRFAYLEYAGGVVIGPGTASTSQRILPPDPGALSRWENNELVLGIRHLWRYALSRGIDVEVPAGRFRGCILVVATGSWLNKGVEEAMRPVGQYRFLDWYAPGVGLVRSESHNDRLTNGPEVVSELVEYQVH